MWLTGSLVLIFTAALVGMTTNPSDYTIAIVDCACAPLEKTSNAILAVLKSAVVFLLSKIGTGLLDLCKNLSSQVLSSVLNLFQSCVRSLASVVQSLLCHSVEFATKVVTCYEIFDGYATLFVSFSNMVRKWCKYAQRTLDYVLLDLLVQTYTRACLFYCLEKCHFLLSVPFIVVSSGTDMLLLAIKYIITLPFNWFLKLVKYVLYSLLHPYVCVVYSSCTVGVFVIMVPVLMHVCKVTDIRPLIRWICAVAINTESRDRVLQILHRMASENGREGITVTSGADNGHESVEPVTDTLEECAVCYQTQKLVKIVPCGHKTTCSTCLHKIERINNRCPICREHILLVV